MQSTIIAFSGRAHEIFLEEKGFLEKNARGVKANMPEKELGREKILATLKETLEPLSYVHAMWEAGAAAFQRVDAWSDIDLQVDVDDERVEETAQLIEQTLAVLSPIDLKYEFPQPAWHGHYQVFYRLRDASPFLLMDLCVIKHSNRLKFLEPEIHGKAIVLFDKSGVTTAPTFDRAALAEKLRARVATLRVTFDLFQILTLKELNRGNNIEALAFYQGYTLRPLVEVLRIRYAPTRYNFHTRYVYYDLPAPVVRQLEALFFIADANELRGKRERAERWFYETLEQL